MKGCYENYQICIYFLLISTLNQVHYAQSTEGSKWVLSDLDSLKEASSPNKSFAQAVLALYYVHGDKGLNVSMENAHKLAKISADWDIGWDILLLVTCIVLNHLVQILMKSDCATWKLFKIRWTNGKTCCKERSNSFLCSW